MALIYDATKGDFGLEFSFHKGTDRPADVFQSIAKLIRALEENDRDIAHAVDYDLDPRLVLQTLETGSLKVWFATALRAIPDEGLKNLDWKKAIGALLVKVKYKTIEWLEGKPTIRDVSEIEELRNEILRLKHEVERLRQMPIETSLQLSVVVNIVQRISISLASIPDDQNVTFASPEGTLRVNTAFSVSDEQLREILVRTHRVHRVHVPLVVKRPDYLGVSMWDVIESGHSVKAKIIDQDWLERFHNREVSLLPGDALMAGLRIDAYFDEEGNVFETKYTVEKIEEVVKFNSVQLEMLANDEGESNSSACNSDEVTT